MQFCDIFLQKKYFLYNPSRNLRAYFSGLLHFYFLKIQIMAVTKAQKKDIIEKFATKKADTGSAEVQIAIMTAKIENLKEHLGEHKNDNHSRRGIMMMVAKRRKMLSYLKKKNPAKYDEVIAALELRK